MDKGITSLLTAHEGQKRVGPKNKNMVLIEIMNTISTPISTPLSNLTTITLGIKKCTLPRKLGPYLM